MPAIGTRTYNGIIATIRMRLKMFDTAKYTKPEIRNDIYDAICELSELLGSKNDPIYRSSQIIPLSKSVVSNSLAAVTYTGSSRILTVPLASTNANNVWTNDTDGFDTTWYGAVGVLSYNDGSGGDSIGDGNVQKTFTIAASPGTGIAELVGGQPTQLLLPVGFMTGTLVSGSNPILSLSIISASSVVANTVDISNVADFKYIDRITLINDSIKGPCIEMPEVSFRAIEKYGSADENPYSEDIIWYRAGSTIYFNKGQSITSYGVRTMFYTRLPIKPTTYTEYVDFPDSQMKLLIDVVALGILKALNEKIPTEYNEVNNKLASLRAATNEDRAKHEANAKTQ